MGSGRVHIEAAARSRRKDGMGDGTEGPLWRKWAWFAGLWVAGVLVVGSAGYLLRWWLHP